MVLSGEQGGEFVNE